MKKVITTAAFVLSSIASIRYLYDKTKKSESADITWIDYDIEDEETPEPKPMFYVGDTVLLYSPYTAEFYKKEWRVAPETYEVVDYKYDEDEEVFRYKLSERPFEWYSEDWLSLPTATTFVKKDTPIKSAGELTATPEMLLSESLIISKVLDGYAREFTVDTLLDRMNNGTAEEKAEAKRQLHELKAKGEI